MLLLSWSGVSHLCCSCLVWQVGQEVDPEFQPRFSVGPAAGTISSFPPALFGPPISDPRPPLRGQAASFLSAAPSCTSSDGANLDGASEDKQQRWALTGQRRQAPWTSEEFSSDTRGRCSSQWWCSNWVRRNFGHQRSRQHVSEFSKSLGRNKLLRERGFWIKDSLIYWFQPKLFFFLKLQRRMFVLWGSISFLGGVFVDPGTLRIPVDPFFP